MDKASNTFSYAIGGIAIISTISSLLLYSRVFLPNTQLRILDDLLTETRTIYHKAEAEGLLPCDVSAKAKAKLLRYEARCEVLREITYRAQSSLDKVRGLFRGHSTRIMRLSNDVEVLRGTLVTTSQKEMARRNRQRPGFQPVTEFADDINDAGVVTLVHPDHDEDGLRPSLDVVSTVSVRVVDSNLDATTTRPITPPTIITCQCCVCSMARWWTTQIFHRKSTSSGHPVIDPLSRTSTLVDEPSASLAPTRWALLARWVFTKPEQEGDYENPDLQSRRPSLRSWINRLTQKPCDASKAAGPDDDAESLPV